MSQLQERYRAFLKEYRNIRQLAYINSLLDWDQQVYMPKLGVEARSEQSGLLASLIHQKRTAAKFVELVSGLREESSLGDDEKVNIREVWKDVERARKIPAQLVVALAEAESRTYNSWVHAKNQRSFDLVKNDLMELVRLKIEYAGCLQNGGSKYDALLDTYEANLSAADVSRLFSRLQPALSDLLARVLSKTAGQVLVNPVKGDISSHRQREFNSFIIKKIGFDFERGRLDETVHPFCGEGGPNDIRLTTRFHEKDITRGLWSTLHEAGHGLYEQGLLSKYAFTPLAESVSLGVHESQSRIWENNIGRSRPFVDFLFPLLKKYFAIEFADVTWEKFYRYINSVRSTLIRIEADEVSYGLHIVIRFEIEKALIEGEISLSELPEVWNERYLAYLGIKPQHDAEGLLQDVHWFSGSFGYFPTYLLGTLYAAQLEAKIKRDMPNLPTRIANGDFSEINLWLQKNVHQHGKRYCGRELIEKASGEETRPEHLIEYLNNKFGEIYEL